MRKFPQVERIQTEGGRGGESVCWKQRKVRKNAREAK